MAVLASRSRFKFVDRYRTTVDLHRLLVLVHAAFVIGPAKKQQSIANDEYNCTDSATRLADEQLMVWSRTTSKEFDHAPICKAMVDESK